VLRADPHAEASCAAYDGYTGFPVRRASYPSACAPAPRERWGWSLAFPSMPS
jgi:hypothetical protein